MLLPLLASHQAAGQSQRFLSEACVQSDLPLRGVCKLVQWQAVAASGPESAAFFAVCASNDLLQTGSHNPPVRY